MKINIYRDKYTQEDSMDIIYLRSVDDGTNQYQGVEATEELVKERILKKFNILINKSCNTQST